MISLNGIPLTGKALAKLVAADFEDFYQPGQRIRVEIIAQNVNFPVLKTLKAVSRIFIPHEMANEEIAEPDRLHFHLFMLGHEIAHLVNEHGLAGDQPPTDHAMLELWADWYGAKVVMALLTFGKRLYPLYAQIYPGGVFSAPMKSIGAAMGMLVKYVYKEHEKYPKPLERVGLAVCGICSFMRLHLPPTRGDWYVGVFMYVSGSPEVRELMILHPEHMKFDPEPIARIRRWHREMQGTRYAISPGMLPFFQIFLSTVWNQTDEELAKAYEIRVAEMRALGHDI